MRSSLYRFYALTGMLFIAALIAWQCTAGLDTPNEPAIPSAMSSVHKPAPVMTVTTGYPDLAIDSLRLAQSIKIAFKKFKPSDCAVLETCAVAGRRKLVRFDVATPNVGSADLYLGNPGDHPEWYVYSPCHGHFHLRGFSEYRLRNTGGIVLTGHKQAFCLMDVTNYWPGFPSQGYTCQNQGISVGWGDVYGSQLDCQWLDITDVAPGKYFIEVVINKSGVINEGTNVHPDSIDVPFQIR